MPIKSTMWVFGVGTVSIFGSEAPLSADELIVADAARGHAAQSTRTSHHTRGSHRECDEILEIYTIREAPVTHAIRRRTRACWRNRGSVPIRPTGTSTRRYRRPGGFLRPSKAVARSTGRFCLVLEVQRPTRGTTLGLPNPGRSDCSCARHPPRPACRASSPTDATDNVLVVRLAHRRGDVAT